MSKEQLFGRTCVSKPCFLRGWRGFRFLASFFYFNHGANLCPPPPPPQEKIHFDSIGHHFGKLGEEGKIGHRVIDLTRPEDLDGKASSSSVPVICAVLRGLLEKQSRHGGVRGGALTETSQGTKVFTGR